MREGGAQPRRQAARLFVAGHGAPVDVERIEDRFSVSSGGRPVSWLHFDAAASRLAMRDPTGDAVRDADAVAAAVEALIGWEPAIDRIRLDPGGDGALAEHLLADGIAVAEGGDLVVLPAMAMQRRRNWLSEEAREPYPFDPILTEGRRHPRRPPKPQGTVYARHIPWLGKVLAFRALTLDDLPLFNRWMNDPRVAAFWNEEGDLDRHRAYLSGLIADPHMLPMIGSFDDAPFAYFELYWAKENRIAPFYDAWDWDRGWHVAVGEESVRGRAYISAWLPSLMHYMFLDDPRTQRIVGEPAASHTQQLRNLERSGFATLKNFDFPHKRASLVMLLRERFFGDRLWQPAPARAGSAAESER